MKRVLVLMSMLGCSDARYSGSDAGDACVSCALTKAADSGAQREERDAARPDGAREDAVAPRTPADALLGKYAVHVRFYGREQTTGFVDLLHELIATADITRDAGSLQMRVETCEDSGHLLTAGLRTNVRVKYPAHYPVRTFGLVVEGNSFHTTGEPFAIGYTKRAPDACSAGGHAPSTAKWLNGSCDCVAGDNPPTRAEDCRVIDSDQDDAPGMTVEADGLVNATQSVLITDRSQYVFGVIDETARRHRANYDKDEQLQELACASGDCRSYQARLCAIGTQLVTFEPLTEASVSCDEVLARVESNQLFPGEALDGSFPPGC